MALIKCPACGADVSDRAVACKKCGYSLRANDDTVTAPTPSNQNVAAQSAKPAQILDFEIQSATSADTDVDESLELDLELDTEVQRKKTIKAVIIIAVIAVIVIGTVIAVISSSVTQNSTVATASAPTSSIQPSITNNYYHPPTSQPSSHSSGSNTFTDSRDGKTYRMVVIGGKTWMAENLNYQKGNSWCYGNNSSNCNKYGRLYNWNTAKTVCPSGWHLSTRQEWDDLARTAGGEKKVDKGGSTYWHGSGTKLRAKSGWGDYQGKSGDGTDEFGFSALPGGGRSYRNGSFKTAGYYGYWWTAAEGNSGFANHRNMGYTQDYVEERNHDVDYGYSVRCVADN